MKKNQNKTPSSELESLLMPLKWQSKSRFGDDVTQITSRPVPIGRLKKPNHLSHDESTIWDQLVANYKAKGLREIDPLALEKMCWLRTKAAEMKSTLVNRLPPEVAQRLEKAYQKRMLTLIAGTEEDEK